MRIGTRSVRVLAVLAAGLLTYALLKVTFLSAGQDEAQQPTSRSSSVFTTAHRNVLDAVKEFFDWRPISSQPIAFNHKIHLANGMQCLDCHAGVDKGSDAAIPSVKLCMTCHQVIATDRPEIKKVATYYKRGEDIPWQRVYGFIPSAHVKFNHAPHIRAGVDCKSCHGDLTKQTVAVRAVNLNMGYCINCHKQKNVSIDCLTCHF